MSGPLNLTVPTNETKTAVPFFMEATYVKVRFAKVSQDDGEKGATIKFELDLVDPTPTQDGGTLRPGDFGSKIFVNQAMYGKDTPAGEIPKWASERISRIMDAFLGTGDPGNGKKPDRPAFGPAIVPNLIGQVALVQFKNPTGDRTSQDINKWTYPGDVAGAQ